MEIKKKISFLMPFLYACEVVLNKILTHLFDLSQYFFF